MGENYIVWISFMAIFFLCSISLNVELLDRCHGI